MDKNQQYISDIKSFIEGEAWKNYALPMISNALQAQLPSPDEERWQEKYVKMYALSTALSMIVNALANLSSQEDFVKRTQEFLEKQNYGH